MMLVALAGVLVLGHPSDARAETAPDYAADLLDGAGTLSLADLRGEVVLLNGWATWCVPCRKEMPYLEALHRRYGDAGLRIVGVSIDRGGADSRVRDFAAGLGVTFPILRDPDNRFQRTFRTTGVPESLLIGRDGEVLYRWKGPLPENDPADIALIEGALAGTVTDAGDVAGRVARIGIPVAFAAGLLSFLSPCVLPLVPGYLATVAGVVLNWLAAPAHSCDVHLVSPWNTEASQPQLPRFRPDGQPPERPQFSAVDQLWCGPRIIFMASSI